MRIFEALSNGVQAEDRWLVVCPIGDGSTVRRVSESAAERPGSEQPSGMHVKGVDEVFPDGEPRSNVGPTLLLTDLRALCPASELRGYKSSNTKYLLLTSSVPLASPMCRPIRVLR